MSRGGRLASGALALVLLLMVLILPFLEVDRPDEDGSAGSVEEQGRRAAYLLLERLGVPVEVWREKPGLLPAGRHVLWMAQAPRDDTRAGSDAGEAGASEAPDPLDLAREGGPSSLRHYRGFVEQGGSLVLPLGPEESRFLVERLSLSELRDVVRVEEPVAARATLFGSVELEIDWEDAVLVEALDRRVPREVLLRDDAGRTLALQVPVGRGAIVLLSSDRFASNAALPRLDHALLLVRLTEGLANGGRVLFDEHALGLGRNETAWQLALRPDIRLVTLHLGLFLLLLLWRAGWAREFPRDLEALAQLDPAARARAQAAWILRARRPELLARMLRQGTLERLLPQGRRGLVPEGEELERELERLAASTGGGADVQRWRAAFRERQVAGARELAELDQELRALEAMIHAARASAPGEKRMQETRS